MLLRITDITSFVEAISFAHLGTLIIQLSLLLSILLAGMTVFGMVKRDERWVHVARRSQYLLTALLIVAAGLLYVMIFDGHYVSSYVYRIAENQEIAFFKITGLWASQEGSLLFWAVVLSICGSAFAFANRHSRTDRRLPPSLVALFLIQVFFIYLMMFDRSNPFNTVFEWMNYEQFRDLTIPQMLQAWGEKSIDMEGFNGTMGNALGNALEIDAAGQLSSLKLGTIYEALSGSAEGITKVLPDSTVNTLVAAFSDGQGMNPQLHNYWIAIHPPTLYFGYIGFTIPFCLAIGSLVSGELDSDWIRRARLWTMASWIFLTAGIAMGGLWAYEILGWGGYWAWDPVENASFIPWLTATAFIHSVVVQERRGMLKVWNVSLIILTYTLTIIGTFLVRSGIISSVHAFGDTGLITPLIVFMVTVFLGAILLIVWRMPLLKADRKLKSVVSREGVFLINNLVLCLIALGTLTMTLWPVITRFLFGNEGRHEFAGEAYLLVTGPLFLLLILMTAVGPLLPYGKGKAKELIRQLAWPTAIGIGAMAINSVYLFRSGNVVEMDPGADSLKSMVTVVRWLIQFTVIPMAAMITAASFQEAISAGKLRAKATKRGLVGSTFDAVLANRRRFGGYIAHIGIALVAVGIYVSSMYEIDTSADVPLGGYALIGEGEEVHVFVADRVEDSAAYRDIKTMVEAESQLRALQDMGASAGSNQLALWQGYSDDKEPFREALRIAHQLRLDPDLTPEKYYRESFASQMDFMELVREKIVSDSSRGPFTGALKLFRSNRNESVESVLKSMPMATTSKMSTSLELAYKTVRLPKVDLYASFLERAPKRNGGESFQASLDAFFEHIQTVINKEVSLKESREESWAKARDIVKGINSFEFIRSHVKIFKVKIDAMTDEQADEFVQLYDEAYNDFRKMLEGHGTPLEESSASDYISALKPTAAGKPFKNLVDHGVAIGPAFHQALSDVEAAKKSSLAAIKAFNNKLRTEIFLREAKVARSILRDFADGKLDQNVVSEQVDAMSFRALRGLRSYIDEVPEEGASDGQNAAATLAEEKIAEILVGAHSLQPQIKLFYDKRSGQPRNQGEAVRDPEIERTLGADLYCILQNVSLKESPFNERDEGGRDRFVYRIFIKPGMNIGIAGLLIIIFGAVFAALPTRRRAPRASVSVKAKKASK